MEILVLGATGSLGRSLVPQLTSRGHSVRAGSRTDRSAENAENVTWVTVDRETGEGLMQAIADADAVIDAANVRSGRRSVLDAVLVDGTARVLDACHAVGDVHYVGISIVGIDDIPYVYYKAKVRQEQVIEAAPGPISLLRATQFHELVDQLLTTAAKLPVMPLPVATKVQPIDSADVASRLADVAEGRPAGRLADIGGPRVETPGELAEQWSTARGRHKKVVRMPLPGRTGRALAAGALCAPAHAVPGRTFAQWLASAEAER
jgi:uncharacterized protein YbjT (DUF2867 family)